MLVGSEELEGFDIRASDGDVGEIKDFYFDDESWVIRYLVVDTGGWLSGRKVLITPVAISKLHLTAELVSVSLSKEEVKSSPDIDTDKPVSRQHELDFLSHYRIAQYWGGSGLWGAGAYPSLLMPGYRDPRNDSLPPIVQKAIAESEAKRHECDDVHLRSCDEVKGYHIHASDGEVGHVSDFLVDVETWAIRYMIVNTSNWWIGHKAIIAPQWVKAVNWPESTVSIDLTRRQIKDAPVFTTGTRLNREDETNIYKHYAREGYWSVDERQRHA